MRVASQPPPRTEEREGERERKREEHWGKRETEEMLSEDWTAEIRRKTRLFLSVHFVYLLYSVSYVYKCE